MMKIPNMYEGELTFNLEEVFSTGFWKKNLKNVHYMRKILEFKIQPIGSLQDPDHVGFLSEAMVYLPFTPLN